MTARRLSSPAFGDVAEHSPWVAQKLLREKRALSPTAMHHDRALSRRAVARSAAREGAAGADPRPSRSRDAREAHGGFDARAGRRRPRSLDADEFARFTDLNDALQEALRLSLHLRGQGRHQAPDPRKLRERASATARRPNSTRHWRRSAASSASASRTGWRHDAQSSAAQTVTFGATAEASSIMRQGRRRHRR